MGYVFPLTPPKRAASSRRMKAMKKLMSRRGIDLCSANSRYGTNWPRRGTFAELWHDRDVIVLAQIVLRLLADMAGLRGAGGRCVTR